MINALLKKNKNDWLYLIASLAILAGFALSIVSWLRMCSTECAESHNWRLFGMPFEYAGFLFFPPLIAAHLYSKRIKDLSFIAGLLVAGAIGAEMTFIYLQKNVIGVWCPVCLSIATCIGIAGLCYSINYIEETKLLSEKQAKGELMKNLWKGFAGLSILILGFMATLAGVSKFDQLAAAETSLKESLFFGNTSSPIEVYVFTDWACPACRQLEPDLEEMAPAIMKKAKLTFVDHAIHTETLNYSPYNVSFVIHNKPAYFKLRKGLTELSVKTSTPTDKQVEELAEAEGEKYQQLNFADITLSQKYFKQLGKQFGIHQTPTLVIINVETKKGKKLVGGAEITESNVLNAIDALEH